MKLVVLCCSFLLGMLLAGSIAASAQTQMVPSHEQSTWPVQPTDNWVLSNTTTTLQWLQLVQLLVNCNIIHAGSSNYCPPVNIPEMSVNDSTNLNFTVTYCTDHPTYCSYTGWFPSNTTQQVAPHPAMTTIHVVSYYSQGPEIFGMYVALEQGGHVVKAGYTPMTFKVVQGEQYQILADDYRSIHFVSWAYPPTSENPLSFTNSGNTTAQLEAMYS